MNNNEQSKNKINQPNRAKMRTNVFEHIYQYLISKDSIVTLEYEYELATYHGVIQHIETLKEIIAKYSVGFELDRIYKVDLSILLLAVYELVYNDDIPTEVAIDQALELSKVYSTEKSTAFINGVLASVYKEYKK